ncbi:hypothetical protein V8E54_013854 [Elaphomyces granulatus]
MEARENENNNVLDCINTLNAQFPGKFILVGGASMVKRQSKRTTNPENIITDIGGGKGYEDLLRQTADVSGNLIPTLSMSLGIKLRCWYLRSDDDYGLAKRVSDLQDVIFVATLMRGNAAVDCSKFLQKYEDNTPDQRELYELMGAKPDTDPLVVEIEYED